MRRNRNRNRWGQRRSQAAPVADITANRTCSYPWNGAHSLTGSSINTVVDEGGNTDLDQAFVAGTKAVLDTTRPVNTTEATLNTKNAFGEYQTPAGGTLADVWPAGTGSYYLLAYFDSHPDSFNAPDWITGTVRAGVMGTDLGICIVDGPKFQVRTNSGGQINEQAIALDAWHLISVRAGAGAGQLKVQIDDGVEVAVAGAVVANLTGRLKKWADGGDAGRADMAQAIERFYSDIHTDEQREQVKAYLRSIIQEAAA